MILTGYASTATLAALWIVWWGGLPRPWWWAAVLFGLTLPAWVWLGWLVFVL